METSLVQPEEIQRQGLREFTRQEAERLTAAEYAQAPTLQLQPDFTGSESETPTVGVNGLTLIPTPELYVNIKIARRSL